MPHTSLLTDGRWPASLFAVEEDEVGGMGLRPSPQLLTQLRLWIRIVQKKASSLF